MPNLDYCTKCVHLEIIKTKNILKNGTFSFGVEPGLWERNWVSFFFTEPESIETEIKNCDVLEALTTVGTKIGR